DSDGDASAVGGPGEGVDRLARDELERAISRQWRGRLRGREFEQLAQPGGAGLRGGRDGHGPRGRERELRTGCERAVELAGDPGQRAPRHPRNDGGGQSVDASVLWEGAALFVFHGRLNRRTA